MPYYKFVNGFIALVLVRYKLNMISRVLKLITSVLDHVWSWFHLNQIKKYVQNLCQLWTEIYRQIKKKWWGSISTKRHCGPYHIFSHPSAPRSVFYPQTTFLAYKNRSVTNSYFNRAFKRNQIRQIYSFLISLDIVLSQRVCSSPVRQTVGLLCLSGGSYHFFLHHNT